MTTPSPRPGAALRLPTGTEAIAAELFRDPDDARAVPVAALWSSGFDAELDAAGLDGLLEALEAFRADLLRLRARLAPAPQTSEPAPVSPGRRP